MNNSKIERFLDISSFYFFTIVSLFGLCLLAVLTFNTPISKINFPFQKQFVGSIFGVICLLGIIAGAYPSRCTRIHRRKNNKKHGAIESKAIFRGHHPACGNFSAHVLHLGDKTYCAGCMGMAVGAIISLLGSLLYFFTRLYQGEAAVIVFWLGFIWVTFGLLQHIIFDLKSGAAHLFLNVMFVLGAFFLLIGIDKMTGNIVLELYLLILIVYWIKTRIILSQWNHRRICASCGLKTCGFS